MAPGKRQAKREQIDADLMDAARRQLKEVGAAGLSLREVARELKMVSSAVYRYVSSRDELLTRLIIESYNRMADAAADALVVVPDDDDLGRWMSIALAVRNWAIAHPHEYLLIFGSPVPGYAAPERTIEAGTRVVGLLLEVLAAADEGGRLAPLAVVVPVPDEVAADIVAGAAAQFDLTISPNRHDRTVPFVAAWTQMFGLISFELTEQTRGLTDHRRALYEATVRLEAATLGLVSPPRAPESAAR